jgi:hypothetical protein
MGRVLDEFAFGGMVSNYEHGAKKMFVRETRLSYHMSANLYRSLADPSELSHSEGQFGKVSPTDSVGGRESRRPFSVTLHFFFCTEANEQSTV